ncbi:hypothetical protein Agub_g6525 [Astrephomene gubernaculifera]|uniref:Ion transport domain-containing protein n=1 Tax=Astrephomene gubernaculifera TaxID=47775 RepID=A0AAD3DQ34_9CHLO|nr:hypothetical protein Agub_g6525 [Astrephomene gubernaculifera]
MISAVTSVASNEPALRRLREEQQNEEQQRMSLLMRRKVSEISSRAEEEEPELQTSSAHRAQTGLNPQSDAGIPPPTGDGQPLPTATLHPGEDVPTNGPALAAPFGTLFNRPVPPAPNFVAERVDNVLQLTKDKFGASVRVQHKLAEDVMAAIDVAVAAMESAQPASPRGVTGRKPCKNDSQSQRQGIKMDLVVTSSASARSPSSYGIEEQVKNVFTYDLFEENPTWADFQVSRTAQKVEEWEEKRARATGFWSKLASSKIRQWTYMTLSYPDYSFWSVLVGATILFLIVLNTVTFCIESVPHYMDTPLYDSLVIVDYICMGFFTVEYVLRLLCCPSLPRFLASFSNFIDLVAIMPFYFECIVRGSSNGKDNEAFQTRVVRLLRILRVLRIVKSIPKLRHLTIVVETLRSSAAVLSMLAFLLTVLLVVFGSIFYFVEPETFDSIPQAMYYAQVTLTTTGYGDVYPVTPWGRFIAGASMLLCMVIISLPIAVIGGNFSNDWAQYKSFQAAVSRSSLVCPDFRELKAELEAYEEALDDVVSQLQKGEEASERELSHVRRDLAAARTALDRGGGGGGLPAIGRPSRPIGLFNAALQAVRNLKSQGHHRTGSVTAMHTALASAVGTGAPDAAGGGGGGGNGGADGGSGGEPAAGSAAGSLGLAAFRGSFGRSWQRMYNRVFSSGHGLDQPLPPVHIGRTSTSPEAAAGGPTVEVQISGEADGGAAGGGGGSGAASFVDVKMTGEEEAKPRASEEPKPQGSPAGWELVQQKAMPAAAATVASRRRLVCGEASLSDMHVTGAAEVTPPSHAPTGTPPTLGSSTHGCEPTSPQAQRQSQAVTEGQLRSPTLDGVLASPSVPMAGLATPTVTQPSHSASGYVPSQPFKPPPKSVETLRSGGNGFLMGAFASTHRQNTDAVGLVAASTSLRSLNVTALVATDSSALVAAQEALTRAAAGCARARELRVQHDTLAQLAELLRADEVPLKLEKLEENHRMLRGWQDEVKPLAEQMWRVRGALDELAWTLEEDVEPELRKYLPGSPEERAAEDAKLGATRQHSLAAVDISVVAAGKGPACGVCGNGAIANGTGTVGG